MISFAFGVILPIFNIKPVVAFDAQSSLIWVAFTAYAIVAHQLFDIKVIIRRTVVYSGMLAFTLGTYSLVVFLFSQLFGGMFVFDTKIIAETVIAATIIAFGIQPIQRWLTRVTDKYLFKGEYDPQVVLAEISQKLTQALDIREAGQALVATLKANMRLTRAALITLVTEDGMTTIKDVIQDGYPDPATVYPVSSGLILQHILTNKSVINGELLRREAQAFRLDDPRLAAYNALLLELDQLGVSIVIPMIAHDHVIAMFMVGPKLSGDLFSRSEMQFITIAASQATNAIEKSRYWQEDQMKSEFVSIASHELLTPTAAIKGYLSMILDDHLGQVDEKARDYLLKVYNSSDRLGKLVEDLLNVSRIESGRLKINKREFSLGDLIARAVEELQVNARQKQLDMAFVAPMGMAVPNVYADPDHIYRVLINLIGNAVKYTDRGWVRVYLTRSSPDALTCSIADSGVGIPAEHLPHLFEKFYRADRKEISGKQGTGLGLYISKRIIELMGGDLNVESTVGSGTVFKFTLPIMTSAPAAVSTASASSPAVGVVGEPAPPSAGTSLSPRNQVRPV